MTAAIRILVIDARCGNGDLIATVCNGAGDVESDFVRKLRYVCPDVIAWRLLYVRRKGPLSTRSQCSMSDLAFPMISGAWEKGTVKTSGEFADTANKAFSLSDAA